MTILTPKNGRKIISEKKDGSSPKSKLKNLLSLSLAHILTYTSSPHYHAHYIDLALPITCGCHFGLADPG